MLPEDEDEIDFLDPLLVDSVTTLWRSVPKVDPSVVVRAKELFLEMLLVEAAVMLDEDDLMSEKLVLVDGAALIFGVIPNEVVSPSSISAANNLGCKCPCFNSTPLVFLARPANVPASRMYLPLDLA